MAETTNDLDVLEAEIADLVAKIQQTKSEVHKVVVGQEEVMDQMLIGMLAGGHVLLEGLPGLAKTLMVKSLAKAVSLNFNRIQFTPDLMPADILGTEVLESDQEGHKEFRYIKGPVFTNILLADEINRTPPKTQAALLEVMQEYKVTYAGTDYQLDRPFFLLATQNPIEQSGTFPLPEAQVDRFLLHVKIGYPEQDEEEAILKLTTSKFSQSIDPSLTGTEILRIQELVKDVFIDDELVSKVANLVRLTRPETTDEQVVKDYLDFGAGPRAGQAIIMTSKARAILKGRLAVIPEDIKAMALPALRHRLLLNFKAESDKATSDDIIQQLLTKF